MTEATTLDAPAESFARWSEPLTLTIQRFLPGPIERCWAYLTDSDLRRQWLAAGDMPDQTGVPFELVWRNDELTNPPGQRPDGFAAEHRMESRVLELDPPHRLVIAWGTASEVDFALESKGDQVLLTLVHRRAPDSAMLLKVSAGWHIHLDLLADRLAGAASLPFWDRWADLNAAYQKRRAAD